MIRVQFAKYLHTIIQIKLHKQWWFFIFTLFPNLCTRKTFLFFIIYNDMMIFLVNFQWLSSKILLSLTQNTLWVSSGSCVKNSCFFRPNDFEDCRIMVVGWNNIGRIQWVGYSFPFQTHPAFVSSSSLYVADSYFDERKLCVLHWVMTILPLLWLK